MFLLWTLSVSLGLLWGVELLSHRGYYLNLNRYWQIVLKVPVPNYAPICRFESNHFLTLMTLANIKFFCSCEVLFNLHVPEHWWWWTYLCVFVGYSYFLFAYALFLFFINILLYFVSRLLRIWMIHLVPCTEQCVLWNNYLNTYWNDLSHNHL